MAAVGVGVGVEVGVGVVVEVGVEVGVALNLRRHDADGRGTQGDTGGPDLGGRVPHGRRVTHPDLFAAVALAQQRATGKHRAEIQRLVPLAQALARKAGPDGITVGSIRLAAGIEKGQGRALSWLCGVPRAAG